MNTAVKKWFGAGVSEALQFIDLNYKLEKVDEVTQELRIGICEAHSDSCFDAKKRQCNECGCKMDFKTQLKFDPIKAIATMNNIEKKLIVCPLNKW